MKRFLALAVALLMCLSCTALAEVPSYLNLDSTLPIIKEGESLTLSIAVMPNRDDIVEDLWFWEFARRKMNLNFEITAFSGAMRGEKVNLMFASDSLPDILTGVSLTAAELVLYGQGEGQLLVLNDYLETYMPNATKVFEQYPEHRGTVTLLDGNIYSLPCINPPLNLMGLSPTIFIHTTKLEEMGRSVPTTLDELYDLLTAFKAEDPENNIPMGGGASIFNGSQYIFSALGFTVPNAVDPGFWQTDEVVVMAGHPLYEQYLIYMNKLYTEGLISKDYYTLDTVQARGQSAEGLMLVLPEAPYTSLTDTFMEWESVVPLTSEWNDQQVWRGGNLATPGAAVISSKTEHPEACLNFLDYFFTIEGGLYAWTGPLVDTEDTFDMVCGWYGSERVPDVENGLFPSTYDYVISLISPFNSYRVGTKAGAYERVIYQDPDAVFEWDVESGDQNFRASKEEKLSGFLTPVYPITYFDEDTNQRINELKIVISDFVANETAKFITGVNSLENIGTYYEQLNSLGFAEYQQYYIDSYEVYKANLQ